MSFSGCRRMFSTAMKTFDTITSSRVIRISAAIFTMSSMQSYSAASDNSLNCPALNKTPYRPVMKYRDDAYNGIIIDGVDLPSTLVDFSTLLDDSLQTWRKQGKKGVWLKIPIDKLSYAVTARDFGFAMHHAEKDYLMMTHWLSSDDSTLPPNASHQIGVGCIVVDDEGKLLVVQENNGPLKGKNFWKIPTGLVDSGEDLHLASCREVLEETGIQTEFVGLLCIRHAHNFQFGKSDLLFVCLLKPLTSAIVKQESEIAACEWIELDKYVNQDLFLSSPIYSTLNMLIEEVVKDKTFDNYIAKATLPIGYMPGYNTLYLPPNPKRKII